MCATPVMHVEKVDPLSATERPSNDMHVRGLHCAGLSGGPSLCIDFARCAVLVICIYAVRPTTKMHQPGIKPGPHRWQRCSLPLDPWCCTHVAAYLKRNASGNQAGAVQDVAGSCIF